MPADPIRMVVPGAPRFARVARAAAAACGVLAGFAPEDLEDLRLVVDEVFNVIAELGTTAVEIVVTPACGEVAVAMRAVGERPAGSPGADASFVRVLADVVGHDVHDELDGPQPAFGVTLVALR